MKSKYVKIFMIFALVFAMVAGLFVSPALVQAEEEATEETVDAKVQHDLDAIEASLPTNAVISFPVTYKSVYDNTITWSVQEGQEVITYDIDAHWMVVDRTKVAGDSQKITITYTVAGIPKTKTYTVTKGETIAPTYTITYDREVPKEAVTEYKLGQATFNLPTLTEGNKIFLGWVEEGNEDVVLTQVLVGTMRNLVLKAKWQDQYTVSFGNDAQSLTVNAGDEITLPECKTDKEGHTFAGWKLGETTYEAGKKVTVTKDIEFVAQWTVNKYTLTFMKDNDVVISSTTVEFGAAISTPENPTKNGYTFKGWNADVPATMPAGNLTINATWEVVKYSIAYTLNGGTLPQDAPTVYTVEEEVELPAVSKEGHKFLGWYLGEEEIEKIEKGSFGNLELVAQWTIKQYILTFMNGNDVVSSEEVDYNSVIKYPQLTNKGYSLSWNSNLTNMPAENLTINAVWNLDVYTIKYELNGGKLPQGAPTVYTVEYADIVLAAATRVGFTFEGYYLDGKLLENNTIDTDLAKNLTIELRWINNMEALVEEDANALVEQYKDVLTGELTSFVDQLPVLTQKGSTIEWLSDSTAVSVSNEGVVTITRPTNGNANVTLKALVSQSDGTTSYTTYCQFTFVVPQMFEAKNEHSTVVVSNLEEAHILTANEISAENANANYGIVIADYVTAYDITLSKNDENVSSFPNGVTVKIKLPAGNITANDIIVYHINGETKEEVKDIKVEDGYVVFIATSFSPYLVVKKHVHSYTIEVTAPTCTDEGFTTHTCSCGDTYKDTPVAALGHDLKSHEAKAATCTEAGYKAYETCSRCDYTTYEEIAAKGHAYGEVTYTWAEDYKSVTATRTCQNDQTHVETETVETTYETVTEATCAAKGAGKYTAQFSNAEFKQQTKNVEIPTLEHKYTSEETKPTCTVDGYTTYTCICGHSYTGNVVVAPGHKEVVLEEKDATCTETGLTEGKQCSVCNVTIVEQTVIPAKNHAYGEVSYTWSEDNKFVTATRTCQNDQTHVETETVNTKYETVSEATCTTKGAGKYTAQFTNAAFTQQTKNVDLPILEHEYTTVVVTDPTCTDDGYTTHTCDCGHSYTDSKVPATGHTFVNGECSCGESDPNYVPEPQEITITEALSIIGSLADGEKTTEKYLVSGQIVDVKNTTYGNVYISDGTDQIYIYGLYNEDGTVQYNSLDVKPQLGDTITVLGVLFKYKNSNTSEITPEIEKGWIIELDVHECDKITVEGSEATCTTAGKTDGEICSICKKVFTEQTDIPALNHIDDNNDLICDRCNEILEQNESPLFENGKKVFIAAIRSTGRNYWFMSNDLGTASTTRLQAIDSLQSDKNALAPNNLTQQWIIEFDETKQCYYIKDINNLYINWSSGNSAKLDSTKFALNIEENEDGTYKITSVDTPTRILSLNNATGSNYFAFYESDQANKLVITEYPNYSDDQKIQLAIENIQLEYTYESDITLPMTGIFETSISWDLKQDYENVSLDNNVFSATLTDTEREVILTATISLGENNSDTVDVKVTIPAKPAEGDPKWTLVTDASTLKAGDQIILVCKTKNTAAGLMGSQKYFSSTSAVITGDTVVAQDAVVITLGGSSGQWTLTTSEGIIGTSTAKALKLNSGTTTWTISISNGIATIKSTTATYGWIQYNASSPRFLNYASSQTNISIFRYE